MGERALAAFGVAASMDGVLAARLSAAPTSADSAPSTAERTGSSEKVRLWRPYQQAVAEGGRVIVFTGGDRSWRNNYLKNACAKTFPQAKGRIVVGARNRARTDITSPAGRKGAFGHATMNPLASAGS